MLVIRIPVDLHHHVIPAGHDAMLDWALITNIAVQMVHTQDGSRPSVTPVPKPSRQVRTVKLHAKMHTIDQAHTTT